MANGPNIAEKRTDPKEARKQINKLNRQRAKVMEAAVSKLFLNNTRGRVAFSGAGAEKGDNKIPLPYNSGNLYIECKTSELRNKVFGPGVPLRYEWFSKIERESKAMGSRFGTLVIHFHNFSGNYIFFRIEDIPIIESISGSTYAFGGPQIDNRYNKSGKAQITDTFYRNRMLEAFKQSTGSVPNLIYETFIGPYVVCAIEDFKQLLGYPEKAEKVAA